MRVATRSRNDLRAQQRVGSAFWFAGLLTILLVVVDFRAFLIEPSSKRYVILVPPLLLMALSAGRTAPLRFHRLHFEDWMLLGLAVMGTVGGLYGKLVNHVPSPAFVAFGPMLALGFLHLMVHQAPGEADAKRYTRILRNILCLYVTLHVLASMGVGVLASHSSFRFEKGFLIAMALVACFLTKKFWRFVALVVACGVIFLDYPAATYLMIGASTVVVLLLTSGGRRRTGLALLIVLIAASISFYATSHGTVKSTTGYFAAVGKQDNSDTRLALWDLAIKQIDKSPVYGHLFTNDLSLSVPISLTGFDRVEPHNDYLQVAMQGGYLALAVYIGWILLAIRRALLIYRRLLDDGRGDSALLVRVLLVGFTGFFVMSIVNPGLSSLGLAAAAFMIHSMIRTFENEPPPTERKHAKRQYASHR